MKTFKKVTLSLKPHQMGMTENQGICSKVRWVMPKQDKIIPLSRCPLLYFGLVGGWSRQPRGLSCSGLFSKEWFRPCVAGDEGSSPRYGDLGPVL